MLEELEAAVAVAIALAVVARLSRRARAATPVARRQLLPVLFVGKVSLLIFAAGLALAPLSSGAAVLGIGLGLLVSVALPVAFLGLILQGRLARAAVGELLVELREGGEAPDLQDALRRALGDPSLELARRDDDGRFVDGAGRRSRFRGPGTRASRRRSSTRARRSARSSTTARCGCGRSCSTPSAPRPASRSRTSARSRRCSAPTPSCGGSPTSRRRCAGSRRSSPPTRRRTTSSRP